MINPFKTKNHGIIENIKKDDQYNASDNELITLSPAGLKGFYTFGVSVYIKENYDLDNYFFSGTAGAWNVYLSYKNDLRIYLKGYLKLILKIYLHYKVEQK